LQQIRADLIKVVRRTGKGTEISSLWLSLTPPVYDELFAKLKMLQSDVATKKLLIQECIGESKRLKKAQLVAQLEEFEKSL
jgi:hypothetical protein